MQELDSSVLKNLYKPASGSHKGDNGKVLIIAGSKLFHAASLWPLMVASRIVDMVFYSWIVPKSSLKEFVRYLTYCLSLFWRSIQLQAYEML